MSVSELLAGTEQLNKGMESLAKSGAAKKTAAANQKIASEFLDSPAGQTSQGRAAGLMLGNGTVEGKDFLKNTSGITGDKLIPMLAEQSLSANLDPVKRKQIMDLANNAIAIKGRMGIQQAYWEGLAELRKKSVNGSLSGDGNSGNGSKQDIGKPGKTVKLDLPGQAVNSIASKLQKDLGVPAGDVPALYFAKQLEGKESNFFGFGGKKPAMTDEQVLDKNQQAKRKAWEYLGDLQQFKDTSDPAVQTAREIAAEKIGTAYMMQGDKIGKVSSGRSKGLTVEYDFTPMSIDYPARAVLTSTTLEYDPRTKSWNSNAFNKKRQEIDQSGSQSLPEADIDSAVDDIIKNRGKR